MSIEYKVDYHIHSYYSDGTMSPVELVRKYHDDEYNIISITDHDGIDGVKEAMTAGEALLMQVVTGVEFSTEYQNHELHLLGYKFDLDNEALNNKLAELKAKRRERNERLVKKLCEMGYELSMEELEKSTPKGYVGKPVIARLMVKKGYIPDVAAAFEPGKIFESDEVKAIKRKKMNTVEAIELVNGAGGIAVLAHPGKIKGLGEKGTPDYRENLDKLLRELKKEGLKGMECFHPSHSEEEALNFVNMAGKYHLHITEGSDYHG